MNRKIATVVLSCLSLGSLSLTLPSKVEAIASHSSSPVIAELSTPHLSAAKADLIQDQSTQEIAYGMYCETFTDGYTTYSCCLDSDGNWTCVW